jgi:hypothetical protein
MSLPRTESRDFSEERRRVLSNAMCNSFDSHCSSCHTGSNLTHSSANISFCCALENCLVSPHPSLAQAWNFPLQDSDDKACASSNSLQESLVLPRGYTHERYHNKSSQAHDTLTASLRLQRRSHVSGTLAHSGMQLGSSYSPERNDIPRTQTANTREVGNKSKDNYACY